MRYLLLVLGLAVVAGCSETRPPSGQPAHQFAQDAGTDAAGRDAGDLGQPGEPCVLPSLVEQACRESKPPQNCIRLQAEDCTTSVCAVWNGSDPFCSQGCASGVCPDGMSCLQFFQGDGDWCVPDL